MPAADPSSVVEVLDKMIEKAYFAAMCDITLNLRISPVARCVEANDSRTGATVPVLRFEVARGYLIVTNDGGRSVSLNAADPMLPLLCAAAVSQLTDVAT